MKALIGSFLFFLSLSAQAQWDLNDVSLLLPLPQRAGEDARLWGSTTEGGQGILLPPGVFQALPRVSSDLDVQTLYHRALRVIALRLDPCFLETLSFQTCQRQVRLVMQPLVFEEGSWAALDSAIHLFYRLTDAEWDRLLAALKPTRGPSLTLGLPLQIHPILRREGLNGPFWKHLSAKILPFLGDKRLVRATAMSVNPLGTVWFFGGVNVQSGKISVLPIPRIKETLQGFLVDAGTMGNENFRAAGSPMPESEPVMKRILFDSRSAKAELRPQELQRGVSEALRLQNPRLHHSGTADCVSCHVSPTVSFWASRNFPQWNWSRLFPKDLFRGGGNPANATVNPGRANVLRAFGYFERDPIVSPRTVNESSEVVRMISEEQARLDRRRF